MPFPTPDENTVKTLYPEALKLKLVEVIHRHGERTPVHNDLSHLMNPKDWRKCHMTPFLHALHMVEESKDRQKDRHTPDHPAREIPAFTDIVIDHPDAKLEDFKAVEQLKQAVRGGDCFHGQLTDKGKETMRTWGENLRKLYVDRLHFLDPKLDPTTVRNVFIRSTDYARTIESVQHLVDGLYPPQLRASPEELNLEINIKPLESENMHPGMGCTALNAASKYFRRAVQAQKAEEMTELLNRFKHLGADSSKPSLRQIHRLYDLSACLHAHDMPLPKGVTVKDLEQMEKLTNDQWWMIYDSSEDLARLAIGRMLKDLKTRIDAAVNGSSDAVKLALFSGHDSTVAPLLSAFRVFDKKYPTFGAMINIELFEDPTNRPFLSRLLNRPAPHYVRLLYNGEPQTLPACKPRGAHREGDETLCTLEAFMKHVEKMVPKDYEGMCRSEEKVGSEWSD
ncbi:hypothetical protein HK104_010578 [Borealophlyctis nickersoniae]|nr:hypothetical protein HK104_010578 [Borealophlyctis nickersoniae]